MPTAVHVITNSDGLVVNRIVVDDTTPTDWHPGPGLTLQPAGVDGAIGGTYINGVYTAPPEPEESEE